MRTRCPGLRSLLIYLYRVNGFCCAWIRNGSCMNQKGYKFLFCKLIISTLICLSLRINYYYQNYCVSVCMHNSMQGAYCFCITNSLFLSSLIRRRRPGSLEGKLFFCRIIGAYIISTTHILDSKVMFKINHVKWDTLYESTDEAFFL